MFGLTTRELKLLRRLRTPQQAQDFLNHIPINFETTGATCLSPRRVLREGRAHCVEGALLGALILRLQGHSPLVVDLRSVWHDDDHLVAVFRERGKWGALSKTNHAVLRYREPIYASVHELVMSYFHEYFTDDGRKTLRSYAGPVNLARFDARGWITAETNLTYLNHYLDRLPHRPLLTPRQVRALRLADRIERSAGRLVEWKKPKRS